MVCAPALEAQDVLDAIAFFVLCFATRQDAIDQMTCRHVAIWQDTQKVRQMYLHVRESSWYLVWCQVSLICHVSAAGHRS